MGNVGRVFVRDVRRLLKVPPALVVVVALLVLPSLYTWYNVIGFWNPYEQTGNLRVCVVNQDAGASSELTGELDLGDRIVEQLQQNTQLSWQFTDYEDAMAQVRSGQSYAAFVIPEDFTANLLSLTTGSFTKPELQYYVNEKLGPVSPKITDTGASTLDETINSTFVATVSKAAADAIDQSLAESSADLSAIQSRAAAKLQGAGQAIAEGRTALAQMGEAAGTALERSEAARGKLDGARDSIGEAADALEAIADLTASLQEGVNRFSAVALPAVNQSIMAFSQMAAKTNGAVGDAVAAVHEAQGSVRSAVAEAQAIVDQCDAAIDQLRALEEGIDDPAQKQVVQQAIASLEATSATARTTLANLQALSADIDATASAVDAASNAFNDAAQTASAEAQGYASTLFGTTLPTIGSSLGQLSSTASAMASAVGSERALVDQAAPVLDQLDTTLRAARDALAQSDGLLASLEQQIGAVRGDVQALSISDALTQAFGEDRLDAADIADFMGAPTQLRTEQLYPLNAYGSAMAPLFMNLTFWIGAFMLMVILKQEVDAEGIRNLTITQRYLGRFALLAVMVTLQAIICCAGVLALGVQAVSAPALFAAAIVASLAYLSIIYALSVTLQHVGKGLCIVLVFAQIPGATGLYPIEMTSPFFQTVYPALPFTYGINAMREAICGFYGAQYTGDLGVLALFFAVSMALGIVLRPRLANVNRMVARQVRQSGIFNGEDVEVPQRRYRLSQVVRALADKDEYRDEIQRRYDRFKRLYPRLIRGALVAGVAVPAALVLVFSVTPTEKVVALTVWLGWLVAIIAFLIVVESLRYSIDRQLRLEALPDDELRALYRRRDAMGAPDEGSVRARAAVRAEGEGADDAGAVGRSDAEADADVEAPEAAKIPAPAEEGVRS